MKKINLIIIILTLLFMISTMSLFSLDTGGNICIVNYWYQTGITSDPSGTAYVDYGIGKIEQINSATPVKFINDMKLKGWTLVQSNMVLVAPINGTWCNIYMLFEKKK
jgi:hypothetical protein